MSTDTLTVVVIAKNEEEMIEECLASVSFADRIILINNASTDKTAEIAKKMGAQVISTDTTDFSKLRELGLSKANSEYLLYIDADERVSPELQKEILSTIKSISSFTAYRIPRQNFYLGKNPWPTVEHLERLFKREALKGWRGTLHETPIIEGEIGNLTIPLQHYTHRDFASMVEKTNTWSEVEASLRLSAAHPPITWWRFPRVMLQAFFTSYITQKGWQAGTMGLLESIYQSFSIFITYAKLWEMQQENKRKRNN